MVNGSIVTNSGKKLILNRAFKSTPDYTAPSYYKVGISNGTVHVTHADLSVPVPISNGTVIHNASTILSGTLYGSNSTNNTTTYKEGAGQTDNTAQNLLTLTTGTVKAWFLFPTTNQFVADSSFSCWVYIKDGTALNKFVTSGTAMEVRVRTHGDVWERYFGLTKTSAQLSTGWNYIQSGTVPVNQLTVGTGGTASNSGSLHEFALVIRTNNTTDNFATGDVIYDLMRQWQASDLLGTYISGYPSLDETNHEVEIRTLLATTQGNGFSINGFATFNSDSVKLMLDEDTFTAESKTSLTQITVIDKIRLI